MVNIGLETRSLKLPEVTVLPNSEITLPHVFVGDSISPNNLLNETVQQKNIIQK